MLTKFLAVLAATAALPLIIATSGAAQQQSGLVNVNVSDNTVQVPVSVAANICDVTVAALVSDLADTGEAECTAISTSEADATVTPSSGGAATQEGLINVNLENNTVQVPIAAAANICDVDVVVLATAILFDDATACRARAGATGIVTP